MPTENINNFVIVRGFHLHVICLAENVCGKYLVQMYHVYFLYVRTRKHILGTPFERKFNQLSNGALEKGLLYLVRVVFYKTNRCTIYLGPLYMYRKSAVLHGRSNVINFYTFNDAIAFKLSNMLRAH